MQYTGANQTLHGNPLAAQVHMGPQLRKGQKRYLVFKRVAGFALALAALLLLAPFLLVVAVVIRLYDGGPALYCQQRVGRGGKIFIMYKFRTMCVDAEEKLAGLRPYNEVDGPVFKIAKDPRVTKVGRVLRKYSIDELPQLANVLKGDMSIVGPRPPLPGEVRQYTSYERQRLMVKPGLTCFWQVSGRATAGFAQWMRLDMHYIRNMGPVQDIKIILRTIPAVLWGTGV